MEVRKLQEWENPDEKNKVGERKRFMEIRGGKDYTIADIEALPEGERAELIDGEMFRMDAPTWTHQSILVKLVLRIGTYIEQNRGKCRVIPAPFAVYIKKDSRNYVEPDISVICDDEKKSEKGCQGAPDWVIEILSPSSMKMDCERKVKLYRDAGVREYWIVDPEKETVSVYDFGHGKITWNAGTYTAGTCAAAPETRDEPMHYSFSERIKAGIFENLYLHLSEMDFL